MKTAIANLLSFLRPAPRPHGPKAWQPGLEVLDGRELMSVSFSGGVIRIDALTGPTQAVVEYDGGAWANPFDGQYRVTVTDRSTGTPTEVRSFPQWSGGNGYNVREIHFDGSASGDVFENRTDVVAVAHGRAGNDVLIGGAAGDFLYGDDGDDDVHGNGGGDVVVGGDGWNLLTGGDGGDCLYGGNGWDDMYGGAGDDCLYGYGGEDVMYGGDGNDFLHGGLGVDYIYGEAGDDRIEVGGDWARDYVWGGAGADVLLYYWVEGGYYDSFVDFNAAEGDRRYG